MRADPFGRRIRNVGFFSGLPETCPSEIGQSQSWTSASDGAFACGNKTVKGF
jgi:hypothetical protein